MDPVYAAPSSSGSNLDCKRRCPVYFSSGRHSWIPAHHRNRADLAFHHGPRIHRHRCFLHRHAFRYRAMEASRADITAGASTGLEHLCALRDVSHASGTERVLRLQCLAADRLFCRRLRLWRAGNSDRHRHVARDSEPISVVREDLWGQAVGALNSLSYHAWIPGIPRGSCDSDRDDRVRPEHESHCPGNGRSRAG